MNEAVRQAHASEIKSGKRFRFGSNWKRFLRVLNQERIREAEVSSKTFLEMENLHGKTFLDIGCGSGLFSLVAWRLGARVTSFDYDPQSVACTAELRHRNFNGDL
jgi:2-polyprenyl-3-methyl-5-hydroxy-6-metoxy-1,4-benzoquinol methylase